MESASVATALAKYDLPVPGGPYNKNALQGRLLPDIDHGKSKTYSKFNKQREIKKDETLNIINNILLI